MPGLPRVTVTIAGGAKVTRAAPGPGIGCAAVTAATRDNRLATSFLVTPILQIVEPEVPFWLRYFCACTG